MTRLVLETVIHTVLLPGTVIVLLPYLLLSSDIEILTFVNVPLRIVGVLLILTGVLLGLWCVRHFIVLGQGTPNPLDPPKFLVRAGPYQVVRNPMYVAVACIVAGEALAFGSVVLLVYLVVVMIGFHLFVTLYEEPALLSLFGVQYTEYRKRVPRWFPARPKQGLESTSESQPD